ncbi:MAG: TatD family hydrolase, partial [Candidatus Omnitrophica bacterium]|nr:TatD family hydrolase [Candidatus Omnitrophota bacterium]
DAMAAAPMERILIETDCPVFYKNRETGAGFKAEPKDVFFTLDAVSLLKDIDKGSAAERLNKNTETFFRLNRFS